MDVLLAAKMWGAMRFIWPAASAALLAAAPFGDCSIAHQPVGHELLGSGSLSVGAGGEVTMAGNSTGGMDCELCTKLNHIWCKSTTTTLSFTDGLCIVDQPVECEWDKAVRKPWMCPVGTSRSYWGVFNFVVLTLAAWLVGIAFQACQLPIITGE